MDDLSAVLDAVRLRGAMFCRLEDRSPWAMAGPPSATATFHGLVRGDAVLQVPDEADLALEAGDLVVLCHGAGHVIGDVADRIPVPIGQVIGDGAWPVRCGGRGARTDIVCGAFSVKRDGPPLLGLMPPVLHLHGNDRVGRLVALLAEEGAQRTRGADALVARLVEALFVEVVRAWAARREGRAGEWIAALADPRIAGALAAIHGDPRRDWTVRSLARVAGMSRSGFALTFTDRVGISPLAYLTRWRLYAAKVLLRESSESLGEIAAQVGYQSEASLSKAFRKQFDLPPGAYRKAARAITSSDRDRRQTA